MDNLILLTFQEAELHEATSLDEIRPREPAFFEHVEGVLKAVDMHYT